MAVDNTVDIAAFADQAEAAGRPSARIVRHSLYATLVAPLRDMILEGALQPGEKVPEERLCAHFGVSRTPVREALKVLAAEGVVEILPHRGAIVARITEEQIDELFPIMAALERLAGALACTRASDADIAGIRALHDRMIADYRAGDQRAYLRRNRQIHEAMFRLAGNPTLAVLYQQILTRINACRFVMRKDARHWRRAVEEHERIIAALESRDGRRLANLLETHVSVTTAAIARASVAGGEPRDDKPPEGRRRARRTRSGPA